MNIAVSCNGEGFGHAARVVEIIRRLSTQHTVVLMCPNTVRDFVLSRVGDCCGMVVDIPCFHFVKYRDRVRIWQTAIANLPVLLGFVFRVFALARQMRRLGVDAVISDFDPFAPWAARRNAVPILQINHPGIVLRVASLRPSALVARAIALLMMGPWDDRILVSFYRGDVGPLIRKEIAECRPRAGSHIVLYLKDAYRPAVVAKLRRIGIDNIIQFPNSRVDYVSSLAGCKMVICAAGHQTISEALHLGKPVFVIPQKGQFEQQINARMLAATGRGAWSTIDQLDRVLPAFLRRLNEHAIVDTSLCSADDRLRLSDCSDQAFVRISQFIESTTAGRARESDAHCDRHSESFTATRRQNRVIERVRNRHGVRRFDDRGWIGGT